jgi:class 3 adenylate cyclase
MLWTNGTLWGLRSPTIPLGVLAVAVFATVIRLRTIETAFAVPVMVAIPVGLLIDQTRAGAISLFHSWPYLLILVATTIVLILASAITEAGMRQQFVAQRTIVRQQNQLEVSQRLLRKYAPAAVAERIESGDAQSVGHPQRSRVTAMSSDVAGFTALADQIDPESLSQIINEYMATMSDVVESQGGVVTEFAGDGLMAIFGAPEQLEPEEQVRRALSAANAMHARLADLNKTWFRLGIEQPLRVRIGINTGMLSVGTFGSDGRATYTAIGLQMNVAARIQAQCEPGGILLSSASWHLVKDEVVCDPLGEVTVKGVHFPISIYAPRA